MIHTTIFWMNEAFYEKKYNDEKIVDNEIFILFDAESFFHKVLSFRDNQNECLKIELISVNCGRIWKKIKLIFLMEGGGGSENCKIQIWIFFRLLQFWE